MSDQDEVEALARELSGVSVETWVGVARAVLAREAKVRAAAGVLGLPAAG